MKIKPFKVEEWMNEYETQAKYNIAETCVYSISLEELFELLNADVNEFLGNFASRRLTYGDIVGQPELLEGISKLYRKMDAKNIITTHGGAGANSLVISAVVGKGDHVVSVMPTYQQLYSIPESLGAEVDILKLKAEDGYLPNLDELRKLVKADTKLICINNPNNPTGALMSDEILNEIVEIAREADVYLLCDEVYRHLNQDDVYIESIADLYEKGISVSSMSKVFSLAGLRLGWIATRDEKLKMEILSHRDYNTISCGLFDEEVASIALANKEKVLERSRGLIRKNLEILDEWVNGQEHISYVKPSAGTITLLHYDLDIDSYSFCMELIKEKGVLLTPGDCFEEPKTLRIGYASDTDELIEGLEKLGEYIAERA